MNILKLEEGLRVTGRSGRMYFFKEYFFHRSQFPRIMQEAGIYLFLRKKNDGKYYPVFAGQSSDLSNFSVWTLNKQWIGGRKPNRLCILPISDQEEQNRVIHDILENPKYDFLTASNLK